MNEKASWFTSLLAECDSPIDFSDVDPDTRSRVSDAGISPVQTTMAAMQPRAREVQHECGSVDSLRSPETCFKRKRRLSPQASALPFVRRRRYRCHQNDTDMATASRCVPYLSRDKAQRKYKLIETIGEGSYGVVHKALDADGRTVAIKWLKSSCEEHISCEREVECSGMKHPNIINTESVFQNEDGIFLVMEYAGESVKDRLSNGRVCSIDNTRVFVKQLLAGLLFIHEKGMMHRDIKPDNLVLCDHAVNHADVLKIIDFSLSKTVEHENSPSCSVLAYAAPELLAGRSCYGTPIDCWAVGCVVAELLCGSRMFDSNDTEIGMLIEIASIVGTGGFEDVLSAQEPVSVSLHLRRKLANTPNNLNSDDLDDALDLVTSLLQPDPLLRITAKQALEHPFLQK